MAPRSLTFHPRIETEFFLQNSVSSRSRIRFEGPKCVSAIPYVVSDPFAKWSPRKVLMQGARPGDRSYRQFGGVKGLRHTELAVGIRRSLLPIRRSRPGDRSYRQLGGVKGLRHTELAVGIRRSLLPIRRSRPGDRSYRQLGGVKGLRHTELAVGIKGLRHTECAYYFETMAYALGEKATK